MKEFIDKLIEKIVNTPTKCLESYSINSPDIITGVKNGIEYGCASRQNEIVDIVNELAEEFAPDINVGTKTNMSEMQTGWIPCSERLPKEDKRVLCQGKNNMFIGFVDSFDGEWTDNHLYRRTNVKAWCELPAPYTEGE